MLSCTAGLLCSTSQRSGSDAHSVSRKQAAPVLGQLGSLLGHMSADHA